MPTRIQPFSGFCRQMDAAGVAAGIVPGVFGAGLPQQATLIFVVAYGAPDLEQPALSARRHQPLVRRWRDGDDRYARPQRRRPGIIRYHPVVAIAAG